MKILLVHNFYQSTHVGGEDLVFEQEKKGLTHLLGENNVFSYTVSNDNLNKFKLFFTIWKNRYHAKKIHEIIKKNKINIMHVHNYFPLLTPAIFKAAKKAGAKTVYTLHNYREGCLSGLFYRKNKPECYDCAQLKLPLPGIQHGCYRGSIIQSLLAGLAYYYYKITHSLSYVDKFFMLSETQKKVFTKIQTPILIKSALKPSFVSGILSKNRVASRERKNYLFVGRLEEIKGIDILLQAWRKLDANFVLEIIGTGPDQACLIKQYSQHNIIFLGKMPRSDVLKKMAQAKYFIHPGLVQETQGLTILEALAQGTPVIGFEIGTRKEYIQDNKNGFLCQPHELRNCLTYANTVYTDYSEQYHQLCEQAMLSAKAYSANKITLKQIELYRTL